MDRPRTGPGLGAFAGVFRPTLLTIMGAMIYLREGWLVGNNGLLGALAVIAAAYVITGTTSMSLSSIATNVRVSAGGPFAIVSRALGLEAGGAIGVPLYVAQAFSSVMYLYAFSEGWGYLFPDHDGRIVTAVGFVVVGAVAAVGAELVVRTQAVMFFVVGAALMAALLGGFGADLHGPQWVGRFPDVGLLRSFAIFFPAATGIMVGAGMSGDLRDARRSLPRGTLGAWATTLALYVGFAVWYALVAPPDVLLTQKTAMVDHALFGPVVLVGLLASTLTAALSSLVAAPRLLRAMAEYEIVPGSGWLRRSNATGQPRNATAATIVLASLGLLWGSLDAIAPVITACFLSTYLALNAVVFLEQATAMISFRPTFAVPRWVPAIGMVACVLGLGLATRGGGLLEVLAVLGLYLWLTSRQLETPWETVHSGLAMVLAARLARWAARLKKSSRSWKPDLLVPVEHPDTLATIAPLVRDMIHVQGSVKYTATCDDPVLHERLELEVARLRGLGRFSSWHAMPAQPFALGVGLTMSAMQGTFFGSNLLVLTDHVDPEVLSELAARAHQMGMGVALYMRAPGPERIRTVNVWLSDRSPRWRLGLQLLNADLLVLMGYLLAHGHRDGRIRLFCAVRDPSEIQNARTFMNSLIDQGRLPDGTTAHVTDRPFMEAISMAPVADVQLLGLSPTIDLARFGAIRDATGSGCLFLRDSGQESLLA